MKKIFLSIICFVFYLNATAQDTPKSIDEALKYLDELWSIDQKNEFKNTAEKGAVSKLHFGIGAGIRNSWIRHGNGKDDLRAEFSKLQIHHLDDMSAIILTSFHRKLNNKPLELEKQAQYYIDYWKPHYEREALLTEKVQKIVNKFKVGDTINLYYPIEDGSENAILYVNNDDWKFNPERDLKVTGILIEKEENLFTIKVLTINKKNVTILFSKVTEGDIYSFNIRHEIID